MSAFRQDDFKPVTSTVVAGISIPHQLAMIDEAYHADDRSACSKMIEDLYAMFDRAM